MTGPQPLYRPEPATVRADAQGRPLTVDGRAIDGVRESWLIEDRWWTRAPLRRRYWELVTVRGELVVLFREIDTGRWFRQRGGA